MAKFSDIIGQEQIKEHLQNALEAGKISHAYIINGEKSSGKEFIARVFSMALQCEKGGTEPCQECHSCKQALTDNQPDIIRVTHEKPNTISVDDIRAQVNNDVAIKPYSSPYKVYIIQDAGENDGAGTECHSENPGGAACLCGNSSADYECKRSAAHNLKPLCGAEYEAGGRRFNQKISDAGASCS